MEKVMDEEQEDDLVVSVEQYDRLPVNRINRVIGQLMDRENISLEDASVVKDVVASIVKSPSDKNGGFVYKNGIGRDQARNRVNAKKAKRRRTEKAKEDEKRLADLKIKLMAGDPSDPKYPARLKYAKRLVGSAVQLPVVARQRWKSAKFQKQMQEHGVDYNVAKWGGWLPFDWAKKIAREILGARSRGEYEFMIKLFNIRFLPARPDAVYDEDWNGWSDFLGMPTFFGGGANISKAKEGDYLPFHEALKFARSLKLKNMKQWTQACVDGRVPLNVPKLPHKVYPDHYVDADHWLGTSTAMDQIKKKVEIEQIWVLYSDERPDVIWWAKMPAEKFAEFSTLPGIVEVTRVYKFEGEMADKCWAILDKMTEVYDQDKRERSLTGTHGLNARQAKTALIQELDQILEWSSINN